MQIFIDSADIGEIREAAAMGVIDGVTTNPSLVAKTGRRFQDVLADILDVIDGPVSAEVVSTDAAGMIAEGKKLAALHPNIVVKVPIGADGLKAVCALTDENIRVNVTLIFQASQALLAAKAGAAYVSPFVGRLDDVSEDGMALVSSLVEIFDNYDYGTEILVASIRSPMHFVQSARMGADVATCPLPVIQQLLKHPLTDLGLSKFLSDWKNVPK
ncbi:MAG TPA: fructose-6-phosphate aldolase [Candidatus Limnocylindrales bacterium]|nr:fructose-6-phosphate aldolase [Candidatus Limnocylindrales bacterium]